MNCLLKTFIFFYCLLFSVNTVAQTQKFYIPEWNENISVDRHKFEKNINIINGAIDSLHSLRPHMQNFEVRKGTALISILNSYNNCKVSTDTIYSYADKIFKSSPKRFCWYWDYFLRQLAIGEGGHVIYFVEERPDLWNEYCEKCELFYLSEAADTIVESKRNEYHLALEEIEKRDVLYRKNEIVDWDKQNIIDKQNRISLDSLYAIYGFPSTAALNGNKSSTAWLLMQHSDDCEWVKKWIERFLDAKTNGHTIPDPLFTTFNRFFDPKSGYCPDSEQFIKNLKSKYPESFAKNYGYENFYE